MVFSLFARFAKQSQPHEKRLLLTPLEQFARRRGHAFHTDARIYYHSEQVTIPFLLIDRNRGAYLFDIAPWKAEELYSARAEKAPRHTKKSKDVDVDRANRIFLRKLDAVQHEKSCDISNFIYLPHLEREAFDALDNSFKRLIPSSRAIFADDTEETIALKLADALAMRETPMEMSQLESALFVQYTLLPDNLFEGLRQLTPQQKRYLHESLPSRSLLTGGYGSGKSSLILLKALVEALDDPAKSIAIIQPTQAACELLSHQLLKLIEHAVIHIDPTRIRIVTPQQICKEHYQKVHRKPPVVAGNITDKMYAKALKIADILFADDWHLIDPRYRDYLKHTQKSATLHAVSDDPNAQENAAYRHHLPHSFRVPHSLSSYRSDANVSVPNGTIEVMRGNGYIHTLHLIPKILETAKSDELMIAVPNLAFGEALLEEVADFIGCAATLFDPHKSLLNQDMEQLLIVPIEGLSGLQRRHLIVIHDDQTPEALLRHAVGRTAQRVYIIEHQSES